MHGTKDTELHARDPDSKLKIFFFLSIEKLPLLLNSVAESGGFSS